MPNFKITSISAREILDSRSDPTIEVKIEADKKKGKAGVPSGASTGSSEAWELRDGDKTRFGGKGVKKVVENVNKKIAPKLVGFDLRKQEDLDKLLIDLDGSANKKNLGANAILGVSLANCRLASILSQKSLYKYIAAKYKFKNKDFSLPIPMFNIFNGGKHADTNLDFQEFMVVPIGRDVNKDAKNMIRLGSEIFHALGKILKSRGFDTDTGNEGGYAPDIYSSMQALDFIMAAIKKAGYKPGIQAGIAMDVGSSVLYDRKSRRYIFKLDRAAFTNSTLISLYYEWLGKYPIVSIEDGLDEDDWQGWREMTEILEEDMMIVGDDLFTTNTSRLKKGIKEGAANTILIKPNQIGTLTETIECVKLAQKNDYRVIVSHRSGETNDDFIVDLAVAVNADYLKAGAPNRGERVAKYNRLMEIGEELT